MQHVAIEGLATAGGIQGTIADACLAVLEYHGIKLDMKWVDNFIFFRELMNLFGCPQFPYRLSDLLTLTKPLGIPWHRIAKKGQDSASCFDYIGFCWDIAARCVSVPHNKRMHAIHKVTTVLTTKTLSMRDVSLIIGMLQHLTFVYWNG